MKKLNNTEPRELKVFEGNSGSFVYDYQRHPDRYSDFEKDGDRVKFKFTYLRRDGRMTANGWKWFPKAYTKTADVDISIDEFVRGPMVPYRSTYKFDESFDFATGRVIV